MTNTLKPDLVLLARDYVHHHQSYIAPGINELGKLEARLGQYAVLGNHNLNYRDNRDFQPLSLVALAEAGPTSLNNSGIWLEKDGARLRLSGVGDPWTDRKDLDAALGNATDRDAVILLSHNPDFVETLRDRRVGLVLSGHTHGGQIVLPGLGAPIVPSKYGQKYLHGLVQGPKSQIFVIRGVGTITPPVRFLCRPEIVLITPI
jgi:uncharacterized protein